MLYIVCISLKGTDSSRVLFLLNGNNNMSLDGFQRGSRDDSWPILGLLSQPLAKILAKLVFQSGHFAPKSFAQALYSAIMGVQFGSGTYGSSHFLCKMQSQNQGI